MPVTVSDGRMRLEAERFAFKAKMAREILSPRLPSASTHSPDGARLSRSRRERQENPPVLAVLRRQHGLFTLAGQTASPAKYGGGAVAPVASSAADGDCQVVASEPGLYEIVRDDRIRIVRINRVAVQQLADVDRYLAVLGDVVRDARTRFGRVRILADLRNSPIRTQEAAERMRLGNLALYREGDRVALIVESSLLKMQLRRTLVEYQNIFLSPNAAETWLTALD
jgi:hypothetical protein